MNTKRRIIGRILAAILLAAVVIGAAPQTVEAKTTKNLIVNGNAEKGTPKGWLGTSDKWEATDGHGYGATCVPYKGKYFFWAPNFYDNTTTLFQNVSIPAKYIKKKVTVSAYMAVWSQSPTDNAVLKVSFYNSKGKVIKSYSKTQKKAKWQKFTITKQIPKGTKKIRISLTAIRKNGMVDAYFDNVTMKIKY